MATGNPYFSAVQQTLPEYIPMPLNELAAAGQVMQNRYDTNMQQLDQIAQGIGSIEAYLPDHREYVQNYSNNFNQESEALLEKYNNNAADPNFGRDLRRLTMKYTNDPNIRTIQQANALYLQKQEDIRKLSVEGKRFIDSNVNPTGTDSQGNLIADVGSVRATNFQDNIRTKFRDTLQAKLNDGRGTITNEQAVQGTISSFVNFDDQGNITGLNTNDPDVRDALMYYTNQGYDMQGASNQILTDLQREAQSSLISEVDWGYDSSRRGWANYNLASDKFAYEQFKDHVKTEFDRQAVTSTVGFLDSKELNKGMIDNANTLKKSLNKEGSLKEVKYYKGQSIFNSPENRALLDSRGINYKVQSLGSSDYAGGESRLIVQEAFEGIPSDIRQSIDKVKNELTDMGVGFSSDREALDRYIEILERDSAAPLYYNVGSSSIRNSLDANYIGDNNQHIQQGVIVDNKGNSYRVSDDKFDLSKIDGRFRVEGFSPFPHTGDKREFTGGAIKANAVTKDGKTVSVYLPMTDDLQKILRNTNTAARATASGLNNTELRESIEYRMPVTLSNGEQGIIVPQRNQYGNWEYWQIEPSTGKRLREVNAEDIFASEKAKVGEYLGLQGD